MSITVYIKPTGCSQCRMTKIVLDRMGLQYETVDVTQDDEALEFITDALGFQQVPVVLLDGRTVQNRNGEELTSWSGLRPDLLEQLKEDA